MDPAVAYKALDFSYIFIRIKYAQGVNAIFCYRFESIKHDDIASARSRRQLTTARNAVMVCDGNNLNSRRDKGFYEGGVIRILRREGRSFFMALVVLKRVDLQRTFEKACPRWTGQGFLNNAGSEGHSANLAERWGRRQFGPSPNPATPHVTERVHGSRNAPSDSCVSISVPNSSNTRTIIACERL